MGGEFTVTGCYRSDDGEIVLNADRLIASMATTLAHESTHVMGFDSKLWEGLGQYVGRLFWLNLPDQDRVASGREGAGPPPTILLPFLPFWVP